jgi:C1A family cysteine protease
MLGDTINSRRIAGLGWKKDIPDQRDHKFKNNVAIESSNPPGIDLREDVRMPKIWDQGKLGSCTAHAIAAACSYAQADDGEFAPSEDYQPSRLFIYYNERLIEGTTKFDAGAEIRDGMNVCASYGICPEKTWPYDITKFAKKPKKFAYEVALNQINRQYMRIEQDLDHMRTCLAAKWPFTFGMTLYDSFNSDEVVKTGIVSIPLATEKIDGGHAMLIVGYDDSKELFIFRNSWDVVFGEQGYGYVPYSMILSPLANDFWCIRKIEK